MGVVFSIAPLSIAKIGTAVVGAFAGYCLVAHIWTLNDWADRRHDDRDPNKRERANQRRGVEGSRLLALSLLFLGVALGFFCFLPQRTFFVAMAIAGLGALYSLPGFPLKQLPVASSGLHFIGGLLHFLIGFSLFSAALPRGVAIGAFFALTFVAGHVTQEVQDCASDRQSGIRTTAVVFGPVPTFIAATALFAFAYLYLILLAWSGLVPMRLAWIAFPLMVVQLLSSVKVLRNGLGFDPVSALRERYRLLFGVIGLGILSMLFC